MKKLFKYTSNGHQFLFQADINENLYHEVQVIADSFCSTGDMKEDFNLLKDLLKKKLDIEITPIEIEYIFRNYSKLGSF